MHPTWACCCGSGARRARSRSGSWRACSAPNPIDYRGTEPFRSLCAARDAGAFRIYFFGVGLDPITLCGEMLSVAVIDAEAFDQLFAGLVSTNQEGNLVTASPTRPAAGIPFTHHAMPLPPSTSASERRTAPCQGEEQDPDARSRSFCGGGVGGRCSSGCSA